MSAPDLQKRFQTLVARNTGKSSTRFVTRTAETALAGTILIMLIRPIAVARLKGFFGLDAYKMLGAGYLLSNVVVGLAVIPLGSHN
jgi:hypothetical protein